MIVKNQLVEEIVHQDPKLKKFQKYVTTRGKHGHEFNHTYINIAHIDHYFYPPQWLPDRLSIGFIMIPAEMQIIPVENSIHTLK